MNDLPAILYFVARESESYSAASVWAEFDTLRLRAIDDLFWMGESPHRSVYAWTSAPQSGEGLTVIPIPTQVALERVYFHISEPQALVLDAALVGVDCAFPQRDISVALDKGSKESRIISRAELAEIIGFLASDRKALKSPQLYAEKALKKGALFECYALGRRARVSSQGESARAWFCELFARSFFGMPEEALAAYDEYPGRGGSDPRAQLLAARYRLLLRQFNEARTILNTLSFEPDLGAVALCEMARSYLTEKDFARTIDIATSAIERDPNYGESYLVRGIAHRGVSYEAGDSQGLREAHGDFERVTRLGSYAIAEALYHVGTICARLGALAQAEMAFRQSLFQRDRISARDALIRLLCAREKREEARRELQRLERIDQPYASKIRENLGEALRASTTTKAVALEAGHGSDLWSDDIASALRAARERISAWSVPLRSELSDCAWLDEMINRFAPDGDFPRTGEYSELALVDHQEIARVLALHVGELLVNRGAATWGRYGREDISVLSLRQGTPIPIERFVSERILLGASGDNFSNLESLIVELQVVPPAVSESLNDHWWPIAPTSVVLSYSEEAAWARDRWLELGAVLAGELSDLDEIDRVIDEVFAPGGAFRESVTISFAREMERFSRGTGLLVGGIIAERVATRWSDHERAEGISLYNSELGRIFPVAKVQRRLYLASAADFASKLSGLAWAVAVASVTEGIRLGVYQDADHVRAALVSTLPSIQQFPESELSGVVESLLIGATLKPAPTKA
jgi:tetratricopeptide (TPR) repeat protein